MCIRQELSQAVHISAPVLSTAWIFSASMALETSAFFTANVPPKPQHCVQARKLDQFACPRTLRSRLTGPSPSSSVRRPWQLAW